MIDPILKWPGGKRKIAEMVLRHLGPLAQRDYVEPFAGGAAVFFAACTDGPKTALLADTNHELIHLYQVVRDCCADLVAELRKPHYRYDESRYYAIRAHVPTDPIAAAARTVYLNKCGFNGVYRVNAHGQFNVPFGRHANPTICDEPALHAASQALRGEHLLGTDAQVYLYPLDFRHLFERLLPAELSVAERRIVAATTSLYCDPPYLPIATGSFTRYAGAFGEIEHRALASWAAQWVEAGARVVLSNSDTPLAHELYPDALFVRHRLQVARSVSRTGDRTPAGELLIVGRS